MREAEPKRKVTTIFLHIIAINVVEEIEDFEPRSV